MSIRFIYKPADPRTLRERESTTRVATEIHSDDVLIKSSKVPISRDKFENLHNFLAALFRPDEKFATVTGVPDWYIKEIVPKGATYVETVAECLTELQTTDGRKAWQLETCERYLRVNAVHGKGSGSEGCHRESDIASFRHTVISVEGPREEQIRQIASLPIPIIAIIDCGDGKTIEAVPGVGCGRSSESNSSGIRRMIVAASLYDSQPLNWISLPSCFVRLPGCVRRYYGDYQRLLYLDPTPTGNPISDLIEL
jgi:hypothetical protein